MRGQVQKQVSMFSVIPVDSWIEERHPLRAIADLVDPILESMSPDFDAIYSRYGRPSIPPEQLLKALLLQVMYTIRSEAQLLEHLRFNLLYRWFVGLAPDSRIWDETVFSKNRDRLLNGHIAQTFFKKVVETAQEKGLMSNQHFTVDGTQLHGTSSYRPTLTEIRRLSPSAVVVRPVGKKLQKLFTITAPYRESPPDRFAGSGGSMPRRRPRPA